MPEARPKGVRADGSGLYMPPLALLMATNPEYEYGLIGSDTLSSTMVYLIHGSLSGWFY